MQSGKRIFEKLTEGSNGPEVLSDGVREAFEKEILGSSPKGLHYLFRNDKEEREKAIEVLSNPTLFRRDVIRIKGYFSLLLQAAKEFYRSFPERPQQFLSDLLDMDRKTQMLCMWAIESSAYVPPKVNEFRRHSKRRKTYKVNAEVTQRHNILDALNSVLKEEGPREMYSTHGIAARICAGDLDKDRSRTVRNWLKDHLKGFTERHKKYSVFEWLQACQKVGKV